MEIELAIATMPAANLDEVVSSLETRLNERDGIRELAIGACRTLLHNARVAMQGMHQGAEAGVVLQDTREKLLQLRGLLCGYPELFHAGFGQEAMQEATEVLCVYSFLTGTRLPDPREIGVTDMAYLLGLGDVVGELRRLSLGRLRAKDVAAAFQHLDSMERVFDALMRITTSPDVEGSLKHKQDVARGLIEKTRGELAVAAQSADLAEKLAAVRSCLLQPAEIAPPGR